MKRYGEKATREALKEGAVIRFNEYFTLDGGYRIIKDGEVLGFITFDLFAKLYARGEGDIVKIDAGYSWTEYAAPVVISLEELCAEVEATEDADADADELPTMDTADTIAPKVCYSVMKRHGDNDENKRVLLDGFDIVMECVRASWEDFVDNCYNNECFRLCEIFSTSGAKWAYWRDDEIDADYITKIGDKWQYMNRETGEILTAKQARAQFREDYDGDDDTNPAIFDDYYKKI